MDTPTFAVVREKVQPIPIAMLTTRDMDGNFRSRPMITTEIDDDGTLWFITNEYSAKVREINRYHTVHVNYADTSRDVYVSFSGEATLIKDKAHLRRRWRPTLAPWFTSADDPNVALLRVHVMKAEYWDAAQRKMITLAPSKKLGGPRQENSPGNAHERMDTN